MSLGAWLVPSKESVRGEQEATASRQKSPDASHSQPAESRIETFDHEEADCGLIPERANQPYLQSHCARLVSSKEPFIQAGTTSIHGCIIKKQMTVSSASTAWWRKGVVWAVLELCAISHPKIPSSRLVFPTGKKST